ncbi:hypothetical protein Tco_1175422 [Tanacetum coccineum]
MNHQLLDSQGPIPGMTPVQALTAIQTMADHSQKWHDGSSSRNIESSSNSEGIAAIVNKLENLGRDMKKLKENVHAIQVGCQTKELTLIKTVLLTRKLRGWKKLNMENSVDLSQTTDMTEIEYYSANSGFSNKEEQETNDSGMTEAVAALEATLKKKREEPKKVKQNVTVMCYALLQNHLPPKEQDPGSFILPCSIGKLDFKNALADLGASISIMPFSMYKRLGIEKHYWESNNDSKREELKWENLSLNDWMRIRYGKVCKMTGERILKDYWREKFRDEEDDLEEYLEDLEECKEDKANTILGVMHDKLNND